MKIFFLMGKSAYVRNYEPVIELLVEKGHTLHLVFQNFDKMYTEEKVNEFLRKSPGATYTFYPEPATFWGIVGRAVRVLQNYLRYWDPRYDKAEKLRERARSQVPLLVQFFCFIIEKVFIHGSEKKIWSTIRCLRALERAIPNAKSIERVLKSHQPDVLLVTPLVYFGGDQIPWLKNAKRMGIKTGYCVHSWDNLTNKGLIQIETDRVFVWNEFQREEAVKLHRIPPSKIRVTGAQCYDKWFARRPSSSRKEFLLKTGLKADQPFILFMCSSHFIAPQEVGFVINWIRRLRAQQDGYLKDVGVLIRPHPQNATQWQDVDLSHFENVAIFPRGGANPIDERSRADFFDSMYHSIAVFGINTSMMIEAGILCKTVLTVLHPDVRSSQLGTIHFHYLVNQGLLHVANGFDEHFQQLTEVLRSEASHKERTKNFIKRFVRPCGLDVPCTNIFVEAVEALEQISPAPAERVPWWAYPARLGLLFLAPMIFLMRPKLIYRNGMILSAS